MKRLEALRLTHEILLLRPRFKGSLRTREEAALWVINQIYLRGFEIVELNPNPEGMLAEEEPE